MMVKMVSPLFLVVFICSFLYLHVHLSMGYFKFRPDLNTNYRVSVSKIDVSTFFLIRYFLKLACNEDIHNILNELKFQPDWTTDCGVSCPSTTKKSQYIYNDTQVRDRCPLDYLSYYIIEGEMLYC